MADLIDRQAAIKAIEDLQDCYNGFSDTFDKACIIGVLEEVPSAQPYTEEEIQKMQDLEQAEIQKAFELGKAEAQPERRWIPVTERLPEKDGDYLVCYEDGYREDYGFDEIGIAPYEVDCGSFGIWQENFDMHTLGSLGSDWVDIPVTAWMPLPEPWKGEEP